MKQSKESKIANTLRAMARSCETVTGLIENTGKRKQKTWARRIARQQFRVITLEGYLPWLKKQYKEWGK